MLLLMEHCIYHCPKECMNPTELSATSLHVQMLHCWFKLSKSLEENIFIFFHWVLTDRLKASFSHNCCHTSCDYSPPPVDGLYYCPAKKIFDTRFVCHLFVGCFVRHLNGLDYWKPASSTLLVPFHITVIWKHFLINWFRRCCEFIFNHLKGNGNGINKS